jgi:hypothetical protein
MFRNLNRNLSRHTTRMLSGARRPSPPNYLSLLCRALEEVLGIDKRLLPFMAEQRDMLERWQRDQEVQAALNKVYGEDGVNASPRQPFTFTNLPMTESQLSKQELALAKSRAVLDRLRAKLARNR